MVGAISCVMLFPSFGIKVSIGDCRLEIEATSAAAVENAPYALAFIAAYERISGGVRREFNVGIVEKRFRVWLENSCKS